MLAWYLWILLSGSLYQCCHCNCQNHHDLGAGHCCLHHLLVVVWLCNIWLLHTCKWVRSMTLNFYFSSTVCVRFMVIIIIIVITIIIVFIIIVWWHQFSIFHCFTPANDANFYFSSTVSIRVIVIIVMVVVIVVVVFLHISIVCMIVVQVC